MPLKDAVLRLVLSAVHCTFINEKILDAFALCEGIVKNWAILRSSDC